MNPGSKYFAGQKLYAKDRKGLHPNQEYIVQKVRKEGRRTFVDVLYVHTNTVLLHKSVKFFRFKQR